MSCDDPWILNNKEAFPSRWQGMTRGEAGATAMLSLGGSAHGRSAT